MIPLIRQQYNLHFTQEKYEAYIRDLAAVYPGQLDFRIAETPVFIPLGFWQKVQDTCEYILDQVSTATYREESEKAIPDHLRVPGENKDPQFIAFDFGVCLDKQGELEPQLIELQGFPTIFAWQVVQADIHQKHFTWPDNFSMYVNGYHRESYIKLLKEIIVGNHQPENVVLLEIFPERQKTRVDFSATQDLVGIETVCLTALIQEGNKLFYEKDGRRIPINRIYNRLIFDDLSQQPQEVQEKGKLMMNDLDVEWIPHPNWFYKLSKFTMPFLQHSHIPETRFLHQVDVLPADLENFVVKPLFSFAGQGVVIDVTKDVIDNIADPENWILQKKVQYANAVDTPGEPAKTEIRVFYFWPPGKDRPVAVCNLSRLSKGKMIGVRYNKDKEWVGGSFCLIEQDPRWKEQA